MADKFRLRVNVEIQKHFDTGGYTGERITVAEEFDVPAGSFTEVAAILGKFHETAERMKADGG